MPPPLEVESDNDSIIILSSEEEIATIPDTILTGNFKLNQSLSDTTGVTLAFIFENKYEMKDKIGICLKFA